MKHPPLCSRFMNIIGSRGRFGANKKAHAAAGLVVCVMMPLSIVETRTSAVNLCTVPRITCPLCTIALVSFFFQVICLCSLLCVCVSPLNYSLRSGSVVQFFVIIMNGLTS